MEQILIACVLILLSVFCLSLLLRRKYRLPPSPKGIPFFGNALQLNIRQISIQMSKLGESYDDAFTLRLLNENCVILKSYDIIREALMSQKYAIIFSGRPKTFMGEYLVKHDEIFQTYSDEWTKLRKIIFRGLRTYGTHLAEVEELVQEELKHLVSRIQIEAGKSVDPYDYINGYVTSIVLMLLTGQHKAYNDPVLQLCGKLTEDLDYLANPGVSALMTALPWLRHLPFGYGKVYQRIKRRVSNLLKAVHQSRENRINNTSGQRTCFFDYLKEQIDLGNLSSESLSGIFLGLLTAGIITSRTSLHCLLLILASRPDVQIKIQQEIDQEIGSSRLPCVEDKHKMPYTHAVLWELFRLYPAGVHTLPHCTMEDVHIRDYILPKDTLVFFSMWDVLHDEGFWEDPWYFCPSRFLDKEGELVPPENEKRQRMIAFGLGKRMCIGETLARLRIFEALVSILQTFTLLPDPDAPLPDADPRTFDNCAVLLAPKYRVIFNPRA